LRTSGLPRSARHSCSAGSMSWPASLRKSTRRIVGCT
jgi:hypothetical protein